MRFDPQTFIHLANRNGFTLKREGETMTVAPRSRLTDEWANAFRMHKAQLLPHLEPLQPGGS